jgi:hypothetical protein
MASYHLQQQPYRQQPKQQPPRRSAPAADQKRAASPAASSSSSEGQSPHLKSVRHDKFRQQLHDEKLRPDQDHDHRVRSLHNRRAAARHCAATSLISSAASRSVPFRCDPSTCAQIDLQLIVTAYNKAAERVGADPREKQAFNRLKLFFGTGLTGDGEDAFNIVVGNKRKNEAKGRRIRRLLQGKAQEGDENALPPMQALWKEVVDEYGGERAVADTVAEGLKPTAAAVVRKVIAMMRTVLINPSAYGKWFAH